MHRLHPLAYLLGLAGLIPFLGCGLGALSTQPQADDLLAALIAYGAVILAFLGGVHWGLTMAQVPPRAEATRFGLGVLPSLAGWVALLVPMVLPRELGLAVLIPGYAALIAAETRGRRRDLVPPGYMVLRWALSAVVLIVLVAVFVARLLGAHVNI